MEVGRRALAATTAIPAETYIACVAGPGPYQWPAKPLKMSAVNVSDGTVAYFDSTQGVPFERALAASNASPGIVAPIPIGDQRYMDGYVYGTGIEGASGSAVVIAITPTQAPRAMQEFATVRATGSQGIDIAPDAASVAAFGPNIYDASRSKPIAEAGRRQAALMAEQVRRLWSPAGARAGGP
jgi:NTE family protein